MSHVISQWQTDQEAGIGLAVDSEALAILSQQLQEEFSNTSSALAKTIFRVYDTDTDGYLSPSDVASLIRDALELMTSQGSLFIQSFIARSLKQATPLVAAAGRGAADEDVTALRERLAVVEEEALALHTAQMAELQTGHAAFAARLISAINSSAQGAAPSPAAPAASSAFASARVSQAAFLSGFLPAFARALDPAFSPLAGDALATSALSAMAAFNAQALVSSSTLPSGGPGPDSRRGSDASELNPGPAAGAGAAQATPGSPLGSPTQTPRHGRRPSTFSLAPAATK
jgi:hypothetical protein